MLTRAQYEIAAALLERAATEFEVHGKQNHGSCNYELPMEPEMVELANEYERWRVIDAEHDTVPVIHAFDTGKRLVFNDASLMSFLAAKLTEEQAAWEGADEAAESIDKLITAMDKDLDDLRKKWASYAKKADGTDDQARVINVLVAAHVATKKFAMIAEHYARPVFHGQRNEWKQIEKSIEQAVEAWLTRPADGSVGLRRVK